MTNALACEAVARTLKHVVLPVSPSTYHSLLPSLSLFPFSTFPFFLSLPSPSRYGIRCASLAVNQPSGRPRDSALSPSPLSRTFSVPPPRLRLLSSFPHSPLILHSSSNIDRGASVSPDPWAALHGEVQLRFERFFDNVPSFLLIRVPSFFLPLALVIFSLCSFTFF